MDNKRVFLTGATGFVGGFVVEELINAGFEVFIAARKSSSFEYLDTQKITVLYLDLADPKAIAQTLIENDIQYVINNAGLTRHADEQQLNLVNAVYTKNIAQAIVESQIPIQKMVHISSLAAFGPADFTQSGVVQSNSQPNPVTAYGRSKLLGEQWLSEFDIPKVILRPTAVYGPREKDLLSVFKMISNRLEVNIGIQQKLSFIYVKDLANIIVQTLISPMSNMDYFVSDGFVYSNEELNTLIKNAVDKKTLKINLPLFVVKPLSSISEQIGRMFGNYPVFNKDKYNEITAQSWICDSAPLLSDLNYKIAYPLNIGIQETVEWYKKAGWIS